MSNCCKCAKWWPHNWICLKGLSVLFTVLFYLCLAFSIYMIIAICTNPVLRGSGAGNMVAYMIYNVLPVLFSAVAFLTTAKVLNVLRKIKKAVSPCCCEVEHEEVVEEVAQEEETAEATEENK